MRPILLLILSIFTADATTCADGWESPSSGRGTCSHHGGIASGPIVYYTPTPPTRTLSPLPIAKHDCVSPGRVSCEMARYVYKVLNQDSVYYIQEYGVAVYESTRRVALDELLTHCHNR